MTYKNKLALSGILTGLWFLSSLTPVAAGNNNEWEKSSYEKDSGRINIWRKMDKNYWDNKFTDYSDKFDWSKNDYQGDKDRDYDKSAQYDRYKYDQNKDYEDDDEVKKDDKKDSYDKYRDKNTGRGGDSNYVKIIFASDKSDHKDGYDHSDRYKKPEYNEHDKWYLGYSAKLNREAVAMAKYELAKGDKSEAKQVAQKMLVAHSANIGKIEALWDKLFDDKLPGGMSTDKLWTLKNAKNTDRAFLKLMTKLHREAVHFDEVELKEGKNSDVKDFARNDAEKGRAEIEELKNLRQSLFSESND